MKVSMFYLPSTGSRPDIEKRMAGTRAELYQRPLGDGMGVLRDLIIADSDEEAKSLWESSAVFVGNNWFEPFGFFKGMLDPRSGAMPDVFEEGLVLVGTVDTVTRQLERLLARVPAAWIFAWLYNGFLSNDRLKKTIELFYTKVLPRVCDVPRP